MEDWMTIENAFESPTHSCPTPWLPTPLPPMPSLPAPPQPVARRPGNPREQMAAALPGWVQPFLTWLTARPAPGEAYVEIPARYHVVTALALALLAPALAIPC